MIGIESRTAAEEYCLALEALRDKEIFTDLSQYVDDAEGFIEVVLGETLTDDLREICRAIVKYPIVIAQSGNGTGKSWIEGRLALWVYLCRDEPQVYCVAAGSVDNLRNILWAQVESVYDTNEALQAGSRKIDLKISKAPLQFIKGVAIPTSGSESEKTSKFTGKHSKSLLFLVDEGDGVPDFVFNGIDTCMSGSSDMMLITFNPKVRKGAVYRMIKSGQAKVVKLTAFNHPNVITGLDVIPGAVNREKTLRRIAQWTRPLADGEKRDKRCFELPSYLVGCVPTDQQGNKYDPLKAGWYRIIQHQFSHVVLGEYPAQADNQLISEEWIDRARSNYDLFTAKHGVIVPPHTACTAGLDIADGGADSSVLCKRFGNFVHPLTAWEKQDPTEIAELVKDDLTRSGITNISAINCDGTGVGAGTATVLNKFYRLPGVKVMVASSPTDKLEDDGEFRILNDQLMWAVREWLRTNTMAMLPPDGVLIEELLAFTEQDKNGKKCVSSTDDIKDLLKRSPDRARALMFSFHRGGFFAGSDLS